MIAERLTPWGGVCRGREALARTVLAGPPRPRGSLSFPPRRDLSPGAGLYITRVVFCAALSLLIIFTHQE